MFNLQSFQHSSFHFLFHTYIWIYGTEMTTLVAMIYQYWKIFKSVTKPKQILSFYNFIIFFYIMICAKNLKYKVNITYFFHPIKHYLFLQIFAKITMLKDLVASSVSWKVAHARGNMHAFEGLKACTPYCWAKRVCIEHCTVKISIDSPTANAS